MPARYAKTGNHKGLPLHRLAVAGGGLRLYGTPVSTRLRLPVITNKEIWAVEGPRDYAEMMPKTYVNLAQRFWYKGDNFSLPYKNTTIDFSLVKDSYDDFNNLNYHNKPFSILTNYFTLLVNNDMDYTTIECFITPEEYNRLPFSYVKFNGDLYYVAEIDRYDPTGNNKCILKLIRKIL